MVAEVLRGANGQLSLTDRGIVLQRSRWRSWRCRVPQTLVVPWKHVEGAMITGDRQDELQLQVCGASTADNVGKEAYVLSLRPGKCEHEQACEVVTAVAERAAGPSAVPLSADADCQDLPTAG